MPVILAPLALAVARVRVASQLAASLRMPDPAA